MPYTGNDETSVLARIATSGLPVYEAEMPEDTEMHYDQYGNFAPFHVVVFGSPYTLRKERSLNGVDKDPYKVNFVVQTFASTPTALRTHKVAVLNLLSGWYPTEAGEVSPEFGRYFKFAANEVRPTMYGHSTLFSYMTNITA